MKRVSKRKGFFKQCQSSLKELKDGLKSKFVATIILVFVGVSLWIFAQLLFLVFGFSLLDWVMNMPYVYPIFTYFYDEISQRSYLGLLYLFTISSLFFLPVPLEALFFSFLREDIPSSIIISIAILGITLGQIINYSLGRFLGFIFVYFIKEQSQRKIKQKLSKYGVFTIFGMHLIPMPFQIFNFITGVLKYSFLKWLLIVLIASTTKHLIMYYIFTLF